VVGLDDRGVSVGSRPSAFALAWHRLGGQPSGPTFHHDLIEGFPLGIPERAASVFQGIGLRPSTQPP
jgi:hypothetical protein